MSDDVKDQSVPEFKPYNPLDPPKGPDPNTLEYSRGSELETAQWGVDVAMANRQAEVLGGAGSIGTGDDPSDPLAAVGNMVEAEGLGAEREGYDSYLDHVAHQTGRSEPTYEVYKAPEVEPGPPTGSVPVEPAPPPAIEAAPVASQPPVEALPPPIEMAPVASPPPVDVSPPPPPPVTPPPTGSAF